MKEIFHEFNPEFYFLGWYDVDEAIHQFAKDKDIDFIITIQRDRSLFDKMFKSQDTKKLVYHSAIPVMVVSE